MLEYIRNNKQSLKIFQTTDQRILAQIAAGKNILFSDFHLGAPDETIEPCTEKDCKISAKFNHLCSCHFIVGDLFDFCGEYPHGVPKGYVNLFWERWQNLRCRYSCLLFVGNPWYVDEKIISKSWTSLCLFWTGSFEFNKKVLIGHGDGLGPGDHGKNAEENIPESILSVALLEFFHRSLQAGTANYMSRRSRTNRNHRRSVSGRRQRMVDHLW